MEASSLKKAVAAESLKSLDPEKYHELDKFCIPMIADISVVPKVIRGISKTIPLTPENTPFMLAVVYFLFCRYKLAFPSLRAPNSIRKQVCEVMKWKDAPTVNYYAGVMHAYYKGARWAKRVEDTALVIYSDLKKEGIANE